MGMNMHELYSLLMKQLKQMDVKVWECALCRHVIYNHFIFESRNFVYQL